MFSMQTVILVWVVNIIIVIMCTRSTLPLQKCAVKHYWKQALPFSVKCVVCTGSCFSLCSINQPLDIQINNELKRNIKYVAFCEEHNLPQPWYSYSIHMSPSQTSYETLPNYAITCVQNKWINIHSLRLQNGLKVFSLLVHIK